MKQNIIIILQLFFIGVLALLGFNHIFTRVEAQTPTDTTSPIPQITDVAPLYSAVYFGPENDLFVKPETVTEFQLQVVSSSAEAEALNQMPDVIYIHPAMFDSIESSWLRDQFASGVAVVAINTPISKLAAALGVDPELADLREPAEGIYISAFYYTFDKNQVIVGRGRHTEYYSSFDQIPFAINMLLHLNGRNQ